MGELVGRIRSLALALGGPGLFLVAFLDSTFLPLPGVVGISRGRFTAAIIIGRGARYIALGVLAVRYGDTALRYVRENGAVVSLVAAGAVAAGFAASLLWRKARAS